MNKKVLIINGNPNPGSFSEALASTYYKAAKSAGATVVLHHLYKLDFNPNLILKNKYGQNLEPDLIQIQQEIKKAEHLVFVYPNWWGTFPALLKGFIDRVFIKGFAYEYPDNQTFQTPLLTGKTARLIVTMDTPAWYYRLIYKQPGHNAMKKGTLEFCGIKPVKITTFSPIKNTSQKQREKYLNKTAELGFAENHRSV
jgi:putative NADPH-quinone reductase